MSTDDAELLRKLKFPRDPKTVDDVFHVSRQTLDSWLKNKVSRSGGLPFLNLDRLMMMHRYYREQNGERATKILEEEINKRYPDLGKIVAPTDIVVLGSRTEIDFTELWIISSQPREVEDRDYVRAFMRRYVESAMHRLVYFVADTKTADKLQASLQNGCEKLEDVWIVTFQIVALVAHSVIAFKSFPEDSYPDIEGLVSLDTDGDPRFAAHEDRWAPEFISTLTTAGLVKHYRFEWPFDESVDGVFSPTNGLPPFQLSYPT